MTEVVIPPLEKEHRPQTRSSSPLTESSIACRIRIGRTVVLRAVGKVRKCSKRAKTTR